MLPANASKNEPKGNPEIISPTLWCPCNRWPPYWLGPCNRGCLDWLAVLAEKTANASGNEPKPDEVWHAAALANPR